MGPGRLLGAGPLPTRRKQSATASRGRSRTLRWPDLLADRRRHAPHCEHLAGRIVARRARLGIRLTPARIQGRRGVAQPGSALEWGSRGRWFESSRPDHRFAHDTAPPGDPEGPCDSGRTPVSTPEPLATGHRSTLSISSATRRDMAGVRSVWTSAVVVPIACPRSWIGRHETHEPVQPAGVASWRVTQAARRSASVMGARGPADRELGRY